MLLTFNLDEPIMMMTWESLSLKEDAFIPKISDTVKSIQLQHYLIVFNFFSNASEQIAVFDLRQKQWLKVKLEGNFFSIQDGSSICLYDNKTIIVFGTDGKQDLLSILSFNRSLGFDGRHISN